MEGSPLELLVAWPVIATIEPKKQRLLLVYQHETTAEPTEDNRAETEEVETQARAILPI